MLRPQTIPTRRTSHLIAATWMAIGILSPALGAAQSTPPPGTMTFALTGDAILTRRLSPFKEPEYLRMIEIIRSADVAFTNLEVLFHMYNLDINERIVKLVTRVLGDLHLTPDIQPSGGGTDANAMRLHGIDCVVVGMSTNEMHTVNEYVVIPDLVDTARFCQMVMTADR